MLKKTFGLLVACAAAVSIASAASAQNYPSGPITIINPFNPGGVTDPVSRQYAIQLEQVLGVPVNIEYRAGAGGMVGANALFSSEPDGYTLGLVTGNILAYQPLVNTVVAFETTDDYHLLVKVAESPNLLVVRHDAPWETFEEFMDAVRENPGRIRAGVSGIRTAGDMAAQQLNMVAGTEITTVPYSGGGGEALVGLLGGHTEALIGTTPSSRGYVEAGEVRVLGVFQSGSYPIFPDATPIADAGYDIHLPQSFYIAAPLGLPEDVLATLVEASQEVVNSPELQAYMAENGYVVIGDGPEESVAAVNAEAESYTLLLEYLEGQ